MRLAPLARPLRLEPLFTVDLAQPLGQCRAAGVSLGDGRRAFVAAVAADFDVDPYVEMFFFPTDTLKLVLFDAQGQVLWRRDLGRGVVPGMWFVPVFPFDLDGDGVDEIWFVDNPEANHPLGLSHYRLRRLDARTGQSTGDWPWPRKGGISQSLSHQFRNFIVGGHVRGEPVLVTAQGTYGPMFLQAFGPDLAPRWEVDIAADAPGARGSHMCPVVDLDGSGVDHLLWGERCLSLDDGAERFCADRDTWRAHSDVIQPCLDRDTGRFRIYTLREGDRRVAPRVACYDDAGRRLWGDLDEGHIDMGWVARLGPQGQQVAMAIRIGAKTCGPDGRFHQDMDEFAWDAVTGQRLELPFSPYRTLPVDLDGDGLHELVRGVASGSGQVLDRAGAVVAELGGAVALASKLVDHPGEQLLSYSVDGRLTLWADRAAQDSPAAAARYAHPFYRTAARLSATGSNLGILGGL